MTTTICSPRTASPHRWSTSRRTPGAHHVHVGHHGRPKAVLTHTNLAAGHDQHVHHQVDINHDVGLSGAAVPHRGIAGNVVTGLLLGPPTVLIPWARSIPARCSTLEAEKVTAIFLVPAQWQAVCAAQQAHPRDAATCCRGRRACVDTLLHVMAETFPGSQILAAFGQDGDVAGDLYVVGEDAIRKLGSVGRVIPTVAARIVDEDMNDVAIDVGDRLPRAHVDGRLLNNPKATAEAFAGGWFHSETSCARTRRATSGSSTARRHDHLRR